MPETPTTTFDLSTVGLSFEPGQVTEFTYRNYAGRVERRRIRPIRLFVGTTEHHVVRQPIIEAWDEVRCAVRFFAVNDIVPDPES